MKKVIVVHGGTRFDTSKAAQYGAVTELYPRHSDVPTFNLQAGVEAVSAALLRVDYDHEEDVIALVGPVTSVVALVSVVASLYGRFNALVFDARDGGTYRIQKVEVA